MKKILFISLILFILFPSILISNDYQESFSAKIIGVTDGDTITVLTENKEQIKIRLSNIDCPEKGSSIWNKSKKENK